ncbi:MAG: lipocalin family protein [Pseudomonadales bacterium]|nr:lipocalin family protein [Pseudomonadales bacterium]
MSMKTVEHVDIERFMGDWYVMAAIPTPFERGAHNAVESYTLRDDGTVLTEFSYNKGSLNGPEKRMVATGYILNDETNARWGMQFVWPFRADYRIIYLDPAYATTIIGRERRDYVWIMSRSILDPDSLERHISWLEGIGYDISRIIRIPHGGIENRLRTESAGGVG